MQQITITLKQTRFVCPRFTTSKKKRIKPWHSDYLQFLDLDLKSFELRTLLPLETMMDMKNQHSRSAQVNKDLSHLTQRKSTFSLTKKEKSQHFKWDAQSNTPFKT